MTSMKTSEPLVSCQGDNPYGYGLRIHLDAAQCKALGFDQPPPVGTTFTISAQAFVVRGEQELESEEDDKPETRMSLQITDMDLHQTGGRDAASRLYDNTQT